jgi:sugar transferase (PEP-CTERM/EpsH1 system associated)
MRILFLTTDLSYPPQDGRMLRTYNVLTGLARRHDVHLVCFDQRHGRDPDKRRRVGEEQLRSLCQSVDIFEVPSKRALTALAWTVGVSLVGSSPFSSRVYRSEAVLRRLEALAAAFPMDVVHVENTLLGGHVAGVAGTARVLVHHNVESDLFRQRAASVRSPARRAFLELEARKMRALEVRLGPRFGAHIVCSSTDAERLRSIMGDVPVCVVPNGVDLDYFARARSSPVSAAVVHVGGLNWPPNLDAAEWLCDEVWPLVRRAVPEAKLTFVGRTGSASLSGRRRDDGIAFTDEVDDVRPFYAEAAVSVVPLRVGGGTRLKILNAWAMGTPVVSTSKGCEGLPARHGQNLLVADTPASFAAAVVRLLREPRVGESLRAAGRRLVEAEYGWGRIVERTEEAYHQAGLGCKSDLQPK